MGIGVLTNKEIEELQKKNFLYNMKADSTDASSLDLTLSSIYYKFPKQTSFSIRHRGTKVSLIASICDLTECELPDDGLILKPAQVYIFKLNEKLKLPKEISAKASGKSTIGRLDVMTRLLTDDAQQYDIVRAGYEGELFVEVISQLFYIKVHKNDKLNQIRFYRGPQIEPLVTRQNIQYFDKDFWFEYIDGSYIGSRRMSKETEDITDHSLDPRYFDLRVDLSKGSVIYRARTDKIGDKLSRKRFVIDLKHKRKRSIKWSDYWEAVPVQTKDSISFVDLKANEFYIMSSKERLCLPDEICVDSLAISETLGDIRIHYAGFAHPGFGKRRKDGKKGTPLVFEVRSNDMAKTRLFDGAVLAKIMFLRMCERPQIRSSPYEDQEISLSQYFTKVPKYARYLK